MKRNSFLRILLGSRALLTAPLSLLAKVYAKIKEKAGYKTGSGTDRFENLITLFDRDTFYTKISTKDTDGDLYVYKSLSVKKGLPNLNFHYN
jgi:hypothetical protein